MKFPKTARFPARVEKRRKVALAQREKDLGKAAHENAASEVTARISAEIASLKKSLRIS